MQFSFDELKVVFLTSESIQKLGHALFKSRGERDAKNRFCETEMRGQNMRTKFIRPHHQPHRMN